MFECTTCGYQTKRSFNFNLHNNRKTQCKPKVNTENVNKNVKEFENVKQNTDIINKFVNINVKHEKKTSYALTCPICLKLFNTRAAKSIHKNKKEPCKPVDTSGTSKESLQEGVEG